jgi:hypothetical protein
MKCGTQEIRNPNPIVPAFQLPIFKSDFFVWNSGTLESDPDRSLFPAFQI